MTRSVRLAHRKLRRAPRYGLVVGWDVSLQSAIVLVGMGLAYTTAIRGIPLRAGLMLQPTVEGRARRDRGRA